MGASADPASVHVWAPDEATLRRQIAIGAGWIAVVMIIGVVAIRAPSGFLRPILALGIIAAGPAMVMTRRILAARSRPCYLSTDSAGIGITTMGGMTYLPWGGVAGLSCRLIAARWTLHLASGEWRALNLSGYKPASRLELLDRITRGADLMPVGWRARGDRPMGWYLRPGFQRVESGMLGRVGDVKALDGHYDWDAPSPPKYILSLSAVQRRAGIEILDPTFARNLSVCALMGIALPLTLAALCPTISQRFVVTYSISTAVLVGWIFMLGPKCVINSEGIRLLRIGKEGLIALRWEQVTALQRRPGGLMIESSEHLWVSTFACAPSDIRHVVDLAVKRAGLTPVHGSANRWERRPQQATLVEGPTQVQSPE